jgi:hypothetical protein
MRLPHARAFFSDGAAVEGDMSLPSSFSVPTNPLGGSFYIYMCIYQFSSLISCPENSTLLLYFCILSSSWWTVFVSFFPLMISFAFADLLYATQQMENRLLSLMFDQSVRMRARGTP